MAKTTLKGKRPAARNGLLPDLHSLAPLTDGPALRNRQLSPAPSASLSSLKAVLGLFVTFAAGLSTASAGDILRNGFTAKPQGAPSSSVSGAGVVPGLQTQVHAQDTLARTTQAVTAVQAMQAAARAAAGKNSKTNLPAVPNGLTPGGLQVAPGVTSPNSALWQGANLPKQTVSHGQTTVTITQNAPDALLNWQTFNVGSKTTVNFDQGKGGADASKWIVFNKINDPSGKPSQILGSIEAPGQVYLINQNGIIFGGTAQINVHTLVASALPIDDGLVSRGLLNNPDGHFLFSAIAQPAGAQGTPAFTPLITDPAFSVSSTSSTYTITQVVATGTTPILTAFPTGSAAISLTANTDYTLSTASTGGKTIITFTAGGLAKIGAASVTVSYTSATVRYGDVVVQAGAQISSPTSAAHVGGRVALVGANVINDGTISTPDGQTILAAGLQVGMAAHPSTDPSLRGLDVYIGQVTDPLSMLKPYAGSVTNDGLIESPRADITMAGKNVNQLGIIDSSTSVTLNGRIDLLANYNGVVNAQESAAGTFSIRYQGSGAVTLGENSVTQIVPELSSTATVVGSQLALPSLVNIQGKTIHFATDSTLFAPGASLPPSTAGQPVDSLGIRLTAGVSINAGVWGFKDATSADPFLRTAGQIYMDSGSLLDVSGSLDVPVPVTQNILSVQLLGAELANSPLQRAGILRGQTLQVDLRIHGPWDPTLNGGLGGYTWIGTPLADASGYVNLIQRTVGQLTTAGGTVTLNAGNSVVMQPDSMINVSGGSISYQSGMVQTTRLISGGQIYDISQAMADRVYQGIYTGSFTTTSPKYGLSQTFTSSLLLDGAHFEQGYIQGANGGSISITAPSMALDGTLRGNTTNGSHQRNITSGTDATSLPNPSSLSLTFQAQKLVSGIPVAYSPMPPDIIFQSGTSQPTVAAFSVDGNGNTAALPDARVSTVVLSPNLLSNDGFGNVSITNGDGSITIPAGVSLKGQPHGSLTLLGANVDIEGKVSMPGGTLSFTAFDFTPTPLVPPTQTPGANLNRGHFTLGSLASLSTAGLVIDDRPSSLTAGTLPLVLNAGSISITSYDANLALGSSIDVSGGLGINASSKLTYGRGGSISISAGQDPLVASLLGGKLTLDAKLTGFSGTVGGKLSITAPQIQIGGTTSGDNSLLLSPDFFSQGGFSAFALSGIGAAVPHHPFEFTPGVLITPGTVIAPVVENLVALPDPAGGGGLVMTPTVLPQAQRTPVSLSFGAVDVKDLQGNLKVRGDVVMGAGSVIQTDPGGSVSIGASPTADTVLILGSIIAPGGSISISGANSVGNGAGALASIQNQAVTTVYIGPDSLLSTAGTTILSFDPRGFRVGTVTNGGTISISGNIMASAGAVFDVSGATDVLDMRPAFSTVATEDASVAGINSLSGSFLGFPMVPTRIDTNGGAIVLKGGQQLFSAATLLGAAGGPAAIGGSLTVSSGIFYPQGSPLGALTLPSGFGAALDGAGHTIAAPTLEITQSSPIFHAGTGSPIGAPVLGADGKPILGIGNFAGTAFVDGGGHVGVDSFGAGGFAAITLGGNVKFKGPVTVTSEEQLTVASQGVLFGDTATLSPVNLVAPYVILGTAFQPPVAPQTPVTIFPFAVTPTFGPDTLTVRASLIDIGNLSLQNFGSAHFIAENGDIRGDGTLDIAGRITLTAGQIYPPTAVTFTIAAYDYEAGGKTHPGTVIIEPSGDRPLPLSAGGTLSIYASVIDQGGVLRAPIGTINLGWDGDASNAPSPDLLTGKPYDATHQLTLFSGSVTSVSAVDPKTGQQLIIPYGINQNGTAWIDPKGVNVTAGGVVGKTISLSAMNVTDMAGSTIDLSGGGDLYAYRFVAGTSGTGDVLGSNSNFAVIPGFSSGYAPYAPYTSNFSSINAVTQTTVNDFGYVNSSLKVGDHVYLNASSGLPAGVYTLLPARYATLPGAYLITPQSGTPVGTQSLPTGSALVQGYRFNGLDSAQTEQPLLTSFMVNSPTVVKTLAEYDSFFAGDYLSHGAAASGSAIPRLPVDAGQLVFQATQSLDIRGTVSAQAAEGGRGGLVDISSSSNIVISGGGAVPKQSGTLVLDSGELSSFGAESLLIGGIRQFGQNGTTISVQTNNITVDNAGSPLSAPDIILVAKQNLTMDAGAVIQSTGNLTGSADTLLLGTAGQAGSGNGTLIRVSSDPTASIIRTSVDSSTKPTMTLDAGAHISGGSITLDSTYGTTLNPAVVLTAASINLNSGQISITLNNPGTLQPTAGLVLASTTLQTLESSAQSLSLLSYSSIDLYGTGQVGTASLANLSLHAAEIRGFNNDGGNVTFEAGNITLDNSAKGTVPGSIGTPSGTLTFHASTLQLGANAVAIDQFSTVALNATGGILFRGTGSLTAQGDLTMLTPVLTGANGATDTISAGGGMKITSVPGRSSVAGGLGATLTLVSGTNPGFVSTTGLTGIAENSNIILPSGVVTLDAKTGDLSVGGRIDVSGTSRTFLDLIRFTGGGSVNLTSEAGSVAITGAVALGAAGANAGAITISAPNGGFLLDPNATLSAIGTSGGAGGSFTLDVGTLPGGSITDLVTSLDKGGFSQLVAIRDREDANVLVDTTVTAHTFVLSSDQGSIEVTANGKIDASGQTGGMIDLIASGNVTLDSGALLTVEGKDFNHAGKGGSISLEAGSETNGQIGNGSVNILAGSTINLSVDSNTANSAAAGDFTGTLHLRAPQLANGSNLQVHSIDGTIIGASSIVVEGYRLYVPFGGSIDSVKTSIQSDGTTFGNNATSIATALLANQDPSAAATLGQILVVAPGAEIINPNGDLTLSSDWNLATFRFGPKQAPGVLTLRASGNLIFTGSLSDGFDLSKASDRTLRTAPLLAQNTALPVNVQSWSYRLTAGADISAANFHETLSSSVLGTQSGSLELGKFDPNPVANGGGNALTSTAVNGFYQVIRTGTGDIDISAGGNVQLLNQFATIYTAGTAVLDPTLGGTFDLPILNARGSGTPLGAIQEPVAYPVQYSLAGGNVSINARGNIEHLTQDTQGNIVADSEKELPINWLFRRGYVDATNHFGAARFGDIASTTWWVDFSNFFEGVGALGGGNVTMIAGQDVSNVDALAPTNARMPGKDVTTKKAVTPDASTLVELGGGDIVVRAGHDIDAGVYYVERGNGTLFAGHSIHTDDTRSAAATSYSPSSPFAAETQLPTTLFLGKGSFNVTANGDVLVGPVANPFLLPEGFSNTFWYKTYFSTYAPTDSVSVSSIGGSITFREETTLPGTLAPISILQAWLQNVLAFSGNSSSVSTQQPWLRLDETALINQPTSGGPYNGVAAILPGSLSLTALSGNVNLVGHLALSPSPVGNVDIVAGRAVNGLQVNGDTTVNNNPVTIWDSATINLSDADPAAIPGIASPLSYLTVLPANLRNSPATVQVSGNLGLLLNSFDKLFEESGSYTGQFGTLQTKEALHAPGLLHANDPDPFHLYAVSGDISGLTLFASKQGRIVAGNDITDVGLYVQNDNATDITVVSAGRDIIAYDLSSTLLQSALASGNITNALANNAGAGQSASAQSGDIQISGPGTLEVLAGRNLTLGAGAANPDGTGVGITSIGNARNPGLPFGGADIIAGAGVGLSSSLANSQIAFQPFIQEFVTSSAGQRYLSELTPTVNQTGSIESQSFSSLPKEQQAILALQVFYLALRDAGRDHNDASSANFGTYDAGFSAIQALFPTSTQGDISLSSRNVTTTSGGSISLFAPGGELSLGTTIANPPPGVVTQDGGSISIFTQGNVDVGVERIFTLRGGDEIIWSTKGNIAAGASSKTVQSAPPTRVLVDPQSGDLETDLAGLATGGGIGVLASVVGVPPGNVDLIAPAGTVDAGDAGIRATGNLNIAAVQVLNASNIQVGGNSSGVPATAAPAAPNIAGFSAASSATGATANAADQVSKQAQQQQQEEDVPSVISVQVIGYGGSDTGDAPDSGTSTGQ